MRGPSRRRRRARNSGDATLRHGDDPQPVVREPPDALEHGCPLRLGHRARLEHCLRRALHSHPRAASLAPHRALAAGEAGRTDCAAGRSRRALAGGLHSAPHRPGPAAAAPCAAAATDSTCSRSPSTRSISSRFLGQIRSCRRAARSWRRRPRRRAGAAVDALRARAGHDRHQDGDEDGQLSGSWRTRASAREQHLACALAAEHAHEPHDHARRNRHDERRTR